MIQIITAMTNTMRFIALCLASFTLTACVYKQTVEQGNLLNNQNTAAVKTGMSKGALVAQLGQPVLKNPYNAKRMVYVYTQQPNHQPMQQRSLIVTLKNNRVQHIQASE